MLVAFTLAISQPSWGQEIVNLTEEVVVKTKDPVQAEKLATKEVVATVTQRFVADLLGHEKAESLRTAITNRLIPEYGRYIPILTADRAVIQGENARVMIQLRFSPESLKSLMVSEGLISLSDQPVSLLPLVSISDTTDGSLFKWWSLGASDEAPPGSAPSIGSKVLGRMFELSHRTGIFIIEPVRFKLQSQVPTLLKDPNLTEENAKQLAQLLKAQLVMTGQISWERPSQDITRLDINIKVHHTGNGRILADVQSSRESQQSSIKDSTGLTRFLNESIDPILQDLHSLFRKGSLNTTVIRLVIEGEHAPTDLEKIRNHIPKTLRSIKSIKERKFLRNNVTFEVESDKSASELKTEWEKNPRVEGVRLKLISAAGDEIRFRMN